MGSSETSQITVDSADMVAAGTSSFLDYADLEAGSMEWTNEKHCLYLRAMEASFVNELHCSMGLYRGQEQKKKILEKDLFQQHKSFTDGVWKNISVNEYGGKSEATSEKHALMINPWIRHFRHKGKNQVVEGAIYEDIDQDVDQEVESEEKETVALDNNSRVSTATLSGQDSVDRNIEISDQNFVDNDESMKLCRVRRAKRSRNTEANNNANRDQVVSKDLNATSYSKRTALNHRC